MSEDHAPHAPHARHARRLALALAVAASGAIAACDRGTGSGGTSDAPTLVDAGGDVRLTADGAVAGEVTSGQYLRWRAAARALEKAGGVKLPGGVRLRSFGPEDVDRLVQRIERDERARTAITGAGIDVRQFVLLSVALERQMALATGPQRRADALFPDAPAADVAPPATVYPAPDPEPLPVEPPQPQPAPEPTPIPAPTPVPTPTPAPTPVPPQRDTAPPIPRDTMRLDTLRTT